MIAMTDDTPFVVSLLGDAHECRGRLFVWMIRDRFREVEWSVTDLEASNESSALDIGATVSTTDLSKLLGARIIEIELVGRRRDHEEWRVIVRDGATVDFLGRGEIPSPEVLDVPYRLEDVDAFGWR